MGGTDMDGHGRTVLMDMARHRTDMARRRTETQPGTRMSNEPQPDTWMSNGQQMTSQSDAQDRS